MLYFTRFGGPGKLNLSYFTCLGGSGRLNLSYLRAYAMPPSYRRASERVRAGRSWFGQAEASHVGGAADLSWVEQAQATLSVPFVQRINALMNLNELH